MEQETSQVGPVLYIQYHLNTVFFTYFYCTYTCFFSSSS